VAVWALREIFFRRRRRGVALFVVVALNFVGLGTTSLQYLGYNLLDISPDILYRNRIVFTTQSFYIPVPVMLAFFAEMVLVFNFSVRRYFRLFEKNQKIQLHIAQMKAKGLNDLVEGVENERRRIARDLHDGACVNIAAINMKADTLREEYGTDAVLAARLADMAEDLEMTYRELRGISHDLMSKALEQTDLVSALEDLCARIRLAKPDLCVEFYSNVESEHLNNLAKIHLYRMAQELLNNVLKHAQAHTVSLQLLENEGYILLTAEDDGRGFDSNATTSTGIGMSNIRARAEVLRGIFRLETAPGRGTLISVEMPKAMLV
jgi:signal transduction histidine kinase